MTIDPIIPRKRSLTGVSKFPPPKIRFGVKVVRDFPPGCGEIIKKNHGKKEERKPLVNVDNVGSKAFENNKIRSFKPKELGRNRNKPYFGSRSENKVKFYDPLCSKEDARKPKITTTVRIIKPSQGMKVERKPNLKNLDDFDSNFGKLTSNGKDKLVENNKFGKYNPSLGSRSMGKVKYLDPNCSQEVDAEISKHTNVVLKKDLKEQVRREKIIEAITLFDVVNEQLLQKNRLRPKGEKIAHWRVPVEAAKIVKQKLKWRDAGKTIGPICGVRVGDKFNYRSQLQMVGLHCQPQSGIDYTKINGKNLAISIVDSHRYSNESTSGDVLVYCGQGGLRFLRDKLHPEDQKPPEDQKLERGNLALKNSMDEKTKIRVIRKVVDVFVYDGLFTVNQFTHNKGAEGSMVFKFELNRAPGQPPLRQMVKCNN